MDFKIKGRKALVTGASRGIGRAIAQSLAEEGAEVVLVARNQEQLEDFRKEHGDQHISIAMDLTQDGEPAKLVEKLKKVGPIDIIVHNMGGNLDVTDPFCSVADWRKIYRFNLEVAVELNALLVPEMQKRKWGRVVHISSIAALENQGTVPYCAMKAALCSYTRSMGRYVSADGVAMSAVLPGAVFTEGGYWDYTSKNRPEHVEKYLNERMAIRRFGSLSEISSVVSFLCSEAASFVVGSSFLVDGGQGRSFMFGSEFE
jgi:3-oxoacyl-[acyl-carrier protein] reductase